LKAFRIRMYFMQVLEEVIAFRREKVAYQLSMSLLPKPFCSRLNNDIQSGRYTILQKHFWKRTNCTRYSGIVHAWRCYSFYPATVSKCRYKREISSVHRKLPTCSIMGRIRLEIIPLLPKKVNIENRVPQGDVLCILCLFFVICRQKYS